jgi:GNAT superfamily N-acetyltransferase
VSTAHASGGSCSRPGDDALSMIRLLARTYDDPDAQRLVRALYAEQLETYGFGDPPNRDLVGDYVQPSGLFVVAYTSTGVPAGCGGFRTYDQGEHVAEVRKMYVHPDQRGQGLGRRILNHLEQHAVGRGARKMLLETGALNVSAIRLYTAAGYLTIPSYVPGRHKANRAFAKTLQAADQVR